MCGIAGVAGARAMAPAGQELPRLMAETMRHRGPDDGGAWWSGDGSVGLGHRRLAVIDLSPGGHQPMVVDGGRLAVVYNGEIYNFRELRRELETHGHRFASSSDTEVLMAAYRAWGAGCLDRLNGMFAFALYDAERRTLLLARDPAGEKPLFWHHAGGRLAFASELKALLTDPRTPRTLDLEALDFYLAYGYVPRERCLVAGVRKLAAGEALLYDIEADSIRVWRYWQLPTPPLAQQAEPEALVDRLAELLTDSVRLRLVADVPLGVLLSGGLDSSLVTAVAARLRPEPVRTFTVTFPGHGGYDEAAHARLVAQHFGTDHTELVAEPATVDLLPTLARQYDEPIADSSMVPTYLVSRLIRESATVALGGDGGDELFGGYPHYSWMERQARVRRLVPGAVRAAVAAGAGGLLPVGTRGRNHLIGLAGAQTEGIAHINMYFDRATRCALLAPALRGGAMAGMRPESYKASLAPAGASAARQAATVDFLTYLTDDILVKVDRASMLASLEVRAPFLDRRIIEFAFGTVPDSLRATARERKVLLRALARRLLPPAFDAQRKQGFSLPLSSWFRGRWGEFIAEVLLSAQDGPFDRATLLRLIAGQRRGLANEQRLFALAMLELWRREYAITLP